MHSMSCQFQHARNSNSHVCCLNLTLSSLQGSTSLSACTCVWTTMPCLLIYLAWFTESGIHGRPVNWMFELQLWHLQVFQVWPQKGELSHQFVLHCSGSQACTSCPCNEMV